MTKNEAKKIVDTNYILRPDFYDTINLFKGEKVLVSQEPVSNIELLSCSIYGIQYLPEEENVEYDFEIYRFIVETYNKFYLRKSLREAIKISDALRTINNYDEKFKFELDFEHDVFCRGKNLKKT